MADIKISELGAASAVNATDLFPMTSSGVTVKATAQQIKNYMGVGNLTDLDTTDKSSVVNAINEVNTKVSKTEDLISNSGDAYDPTRPYKVGELCIYDNKLYRCTTACSAGSWATNQSCFTQDTLVNVVDILNGNSQITSGRLQNSANMSFASSTSYYVKIGHIVIITAIGTFLNTVTGTNVLFDLPFSTAYRLDIPIFTKEDSKNLVGYISSNEKSVRRNEGAFIQGNTFWFNLVYYTNE